jgi:predicted amidohydrolase YtcJ
VALENDFERKVVSSTQMYRDLNALGMTGAIDTGGGARIGPEAYQVLMEVHRRGDLTFKSRLYVHPHGHEDELAELDEYLRQLHPGFGNDEVRYVGIGEIVLHGCYDGPGLDDFEIDEATKELLYEATMRCAALNWPVNIHAIKDSTLRTILDVWERVDATYPLRERRFSISHADGASVDSLRRLRALGAGITIQDRLTIRTVDTAAAWGDDAARLAPRLRDMIDLGIPIGGGTDATVAAPYNPWLSLSWFVTGTPIDGGPRRAPEHRLSRLEALAAYTTGSAWFSREEERRGRLTPGYAADLAVLSDDYLTVDDGAIETITSVLTLVNGRVVHIGEGAFPELHEEKGSDR